ncbi:MAG: hypothetical protein IID34_11905 [Planctomycetes bacterium]|nr:hypothetical protein [Planctomycetota bacterium]
MKRRSFLFAVGACACMFLAISTIGASQGRPRAQTTAAGERSIQIQPPAQSDPQVSAEAESRAQSVLPDKGILFLEAAAGARETRSAQGGENDDCTTPQMIGDGPTEYSTIGNTTDGLPHYGLCPLDGQTYNDDWFTYTATCNGIATASTCDNADFATDLVVYAGYHPVDWICPPDDDDMLGCMDEGGCADSSSGIEVPVLMGQWLTIRVGGRSSIGTGTGILTMACTTMVCGNGECEGDEDCCTCPDDCDPCVCGDDACDAPCEACDECIEDCGECPEDSCAPENLAYSDGDWNGVRGGFPSPGWEYNGLVNDFVLPDPDGGGSGMSFSCAQVTFAVDLEIDPTVWELRVYDLNNIDGAGGGDGTILGMGSYDQAIPVCERTYTSADGTLVVTDTGYMAFKRAVKTFDGVGTPCELYEGHFGFHIMFPDTDFGSFWLTAPQDGNPDCLAIWGPWDDLYAYG